MEFDGLPLHILLVHFTVVLLPLTALCTVASAVWPFARRRLGIVTPLLAIAMMVLVPLTIDAGQWLEDRVAITPAIEHHAQLANTLYPWTVALFIAAVLQWGWFHFFDREKAKFRVSRRLRLIMMIVFSVIAVAVATGLIIDVIQIGEAGARAVWTNSFSPTPLPSHSPAP
jgi:hypothetical protein